jgi:tRNA threonylcarbamoyladenosine biosynthesis protein TsaB
MISRGLFRAERLLAAGASTGPVLGLDTATSIAILGLVSRGRPLGSLARPVRSHGSALPAAIDELLHEAGVKLVDLAGIAVGIGPGSFTGLRIGLSYAKGLAMGCGCPVAGIGSLDGMAVAAAADGTLAPGQLICPLVDARKGEVYTGLYRIGPDGLEKLTNEPIVRLEQLLAEKAGEAVFVVEEIASGDGLLVGAIGGRARTVNLLHSGTRGMWMAALGAARIAEHDVDSVASLQPLYVRPPEARLAAGRGAITGKEPLWSAEKRTSSSSMRPTTRS